MATTTTAPAALQPLPAYTEQDFLDLFERLLPDHYLEPLKDPGPGYELLQAYAAVGARMSTAVANVANGNYISTAPAGAYSVGQVEFYRETAIYGEVSLLPGTIVASADGYTYALTSTVIFDEGELGPITANVQATVRGYLYDKPGPKIAADGSVIPGDINILVTPVVAYNHNFDPTIQVRQLTDTVGGVSPMLDGLGVDRGLPRNPGEADEDYRARLMALPETVTYLALRNQALRSIGRFLSYSGYGFWFVEGWDLRVQMGWDTPKNVTVSPTSAVKYAPVGTANTNFTENVFAWDYDPSTQTAFEGLAPSGWPVSNRLMAAGTYSASLIVGFPTALIGNVKRTADFRAMAQTLEAIKPAGLRIFYIFTP